MPTNAEKRQYLRDRRTEEAYRREMGREWAGVAIMLFVVAFVLYSGAGWVGKKVGVVDTDFDRVEARCDRMGGTTEPFGDDGGLCTVRYPAGLFHAPIDGSGLIIWSRVTKERDRCDGEGERWHADTFICESESSTQRLKD